MSLLRYEEYKDSGVEWLGKVPAHWNCVRLAALFREVNEPGTDELPILSVSIHDGVSDRELNADEAERKVSRSDDRSKYKAVAPGDLTYNMMRAWQGGFGTVAVAGMVSPAYVVARPTREFSTSLVEMMLRTPSAVSEIKRYSRGITDFRLRLYWEDFKCIRVALPPRAEQLAIVRFLDRETAKIDALIFEQEKLVAMLAEKRQATISHAVTRGLNPHAPMKNSGVAWLGEVPAHWDVVGLTKYLNSVIDYRGRTPEKVDEGVFLVTAKNIRNGVVDYDASQEYIGLSEYDEVMRRGKPMRGDVLFTTEAPLGQVAIVDREDIALAQRIIKFRASPEHLLNSYLKVWIMGSACQFNLEQLATGSTALGIKGSKIGQVRLCLPPLDEQEAIVSFIDAEVIKLDKLKREAELAIGLLSERRTALITAAVTGQIDVRGAIPQAAAESLEALAA